jgi:hypothetical protein
MIIMYCYICMNLCTSMFVGTYVPLYFNEHMLLKFAIYVAKICYLYEHIYLYELMLLKFATYVAEICYLCCSRQ